MIEVCNKCNSMYTKQIIRYYIDDIIYYNLICLDCGHINPIESITWIK